MRVTIGTTFQDLKQLQPGDGCCVILNENEDISKIPKSKFFIQHSPGVNHLNPDSGLVSEKGEGNYIIVRKPNNLKKYVLRLLEDLLEFPKEVIRVESFGNVSSERATIHNVANDLGFKISCKYDEEETTFIVTKTPKKKKNKFPWWKNLNQDFQLINYEGTFLSFRSRCYTHAKSKNESVTVLKHDELEDVALIRLNGERKESNQKRFNNFLDTIAPGDSVLLPDEFSGMKDGYVRVLLSNHDSKFSYRGGLITHLKNETDSKDSTNHPDSTTPHIDSNGYFIMDGRNYGKKPDRWVQLKLKHTEWTLEDVRHGTN